MPRRTPLAAALLAVPLAACSVVGIRTAEEPVHVVERTLPGGVEIRRYAPRVAASTDVVAADADAARNAAFRKLAGYIFGGNADGASIDMTAPVETVPGTSVAMTAPVETTPGAAAGTWRMRFFLPATFTLETAPRPDDPAVAIVEVPAETLAVLRFAGFYDDATLAAREADLRGALAAAGIAPGGPVRAQFYDPPWTIPWLRRNELAVPVAWP